MKGFLANPRGKILGKPIDSRPRGSWALPSVRLQSSRAPRSGRDAFPVDACEKRVVGHHGGVLLDVEGTKDKLGVLWTWDTSERGGAFKVLPGSRVLQSVPMMPRFKKDTAEYSMESGMFETPFTLDNRARPPYTPCKCGHQG